jgi:hypothetical protein
MLLIAIAGLSVREREKRNAAERARADFVKALEITTSTLETTRVLLHRQTEGRTI